ncbi:hypothetical protein AC578_8006 [Pseudocercospora eumusae]|uniref:Uncharacterized protein n=1 Tax=Pseudocercospora eumusae TaxID=321146 RepID=A0A139HGX6_9PEZI|nr:hypothetical protein AC578_8006 [Pseudocercospora eumusae]
MCSSGKAAPTVSSVLSWHNKIGLVWTGVSRITHSSILRCNASSPITAPNMPSECSRAILIWLLVFTNIASAYPPTNQLQLPLNEEIDDEPHETITMHVTMTRTHYDFDFHTTTMVRQPRPTPCHVYEALEAMQRTSQCDETACAICRWQARCHGASAACFQCDAKPYCEC